MGDCPPCDMMESKLKATAQDYKDEIEVRKVKVTEGSPLINRLDIEAVPTLLLFKKGSEVNRLEGLVRTKKLEEAFEELLKLFQGISFLKKSLTPYQGTGLILPPEQKHKQIEGAIMPFKKGDVYQCPDASCGCEVTVTKSAPPSCGGTQNPTCCCGKTMVKKD